MMHTLTVDCPPEVMLELHADSAAMVVVLKEKASLSLFREGRISSGLAARWLGVSRPEFLFRAMQDGATLLTEGDDDVRRELSLLE
jgi:hypothetical protein